MGPPSENSNNTGQAAQRAPGGPGPHKVRTRSRRPILPRAWLEAGLAQGSQGGERLLCSFGCSLRYLGNDPTAVLLILCRLFCA